MLTNGNQRTQGASDLHIKKAKLRGAGVGGSTPKLLSSGIVKCLFTRKTVTAGPLSLGNPAGAGCADLGVLASEEL